MLHRYRSALCNVADPPAPVVPGTAQTTTPATPTTPASPLPEAMQALVDNPEAFKQRLAEAGKAATNKLFEQLGVKDATEAKTALQELKRLKDAQLTEQERTKKQLDDLAPQAARAAALEATVKEFLESEEKAIPEAKRGLLSLAPPADQPEARLRWIAQAKLQGLFTAAPTAVDAAAQAAAAAEAAKAKPANPANTIAPPGPPATPPAGQETPQQYYDRQMRATNGQWMGAGGFAMQYQQIDRAAWRKQ